MSFKSLGWALLTLCVPAMAFGATFHWAGNPGSSQAWDNPANWLEPGFPNAIGDVAILGDVLSEDTTIVLNQDITVGVVSFQETTNSYTIAGPGTLILDNGTQSLHGRRVEVNSELRIEPGTKVLSRITSSVFHSCVDIYANAPSTLELTGDISGGANAALTMMPSSVGTLLLSGNNSFVGDVTVNFGQLRLASSNTIPDTGVTLEVGHQGSIFLEPGVAEQVGTYRVDGILQPPGIYTSTAPFIEGAGALLVLGSIVQIPALSTQGTTGLVLILVGAALWILKRRRSEGPLPG